MRKASVAVVLACVVALTTAGARAAWVPRSDHGDVAMALVSPGAAADPLPISATGSYPGAIRRAPVDLVNTGSAPLAEVHLTTRASESSLLDTDPRHGLQLSIERCSVPWSRTGPSGFECRRGPADVLPERPVTAADVPLSGLGPLAAGATARLLVTLRLPEEAGNEFQGQRSKIDVIFVARP